MAKKGFGELLDTALGNDNRLAGMLQEIGPGKGPADEPVKAAPVPRATRRPKQVTVAQRKAVEEVRNAQRGRGKKKEGRKMIAFQVSEALAERVEDLTFALGKTKNDLYNEAIEDLVEKYKNL